MRAQRECIAHTPPGMRLGVTYLVSKVIKAMEDWGSRWQGFAHRYQARFYQGMIDQEARLAGIQPGDKVMHVGCGALPFTAVELARRGCHVVAVDHDPRALERARQSIRGTEFSKNIDFKLEEGHRIDFSGFDAVWISLHVFPKQPVVKTALRMMPLGSRLVYRNPRAYSKWLYPYIEAADLDCDARVSRTMQLLGKETVVMHKGAVEERSLVTESCFRSKACPLDQLEAGEAGIISSLTYHPLFPVLGLRVGKKVRVGARQPFGGPLLMESGDRRVALDRRLAGDIEVLREGA